MFQNLYYSPVKIVIVLLKSFTGHIKQKLFDVNRYFTTNVNILIKVSI
jgi:hypothetical protein